MTTRLHLPSVLFGAAFLLLLASTLGMQQAPPRNAIPMLTAEQAEILAHLSIVYLPDGKGGSRKTVRLTAANLQIVNGLGATNGNPSDPAAYEDGSFVTNGLGNLIVGYEGTPDQFPENRTGSHNIALGHGNSYRGFGGLIAGSFGEIGGAFANVLGGRHCKATAYSSTVCGGEFNWATAEQSSILGGLFNHSNAFASTVSGGHDNYTYGSCSSISGGQLNTVVGEGSSASGGFWNTVMASYGSISGGAQNQVLGDPEGPDGAFGSISGGSSGRTSGNASTVSGGLGVWVQGTYDWGAGSLFEDR